MNMVTATFHTVGTSRLVLTPRFNKCGGCPALFVRGNACSSASLIIDSQSWPIHQPLLQNYLKGSRKPRKYLSIK